MTVHYTDYKNSCRYNILIRCRKLFMSSERNKCRAHATQRQRMNERMPLTMRSGDSFFSFCYSSLSVELLMHRLPSFFQHSVFVCCRWLQPTEHKASSFRHLHVHRVCCDRNAFQNGRERERAKRKIETIMLSCGRQPPKPEAKSHPNYTALTTMAWTWQQ